MTPEKSVSEYSVKDLKDRIANAQRGTVEAFLEEEKSRGDEARGTAIQALEARLSELGGGGSNDGGSSDTGSSDANATPGSNAGNPPPSSSASASATASPTAGNVDEALADRAKRVAAAGDDPLARKMALNEAERDALQTARETGGDQVDLTSSLDPRGEATRKAAARADRDAEGPITGTGAHRLAAPAPAEVVGAPAEWTDPDRYDARRQTTGAPIAPPAPTRGPEVESAARGSKDGGGNKRPFGPGGERL